MSIRGLARRATPVGYATPANAPVYIDSDDNILKIIPAGSGTTEVQVVDASSAQTLTNKTLTAPTFTSPVIVNTPVEYLADGAIAITSHTAVLTSPDAGAYTIAAPTVAGSTILLVNATEAAHVITGTNLFWGGVTGGPHNKVTFVAFPSFAGMLYAHGGLWLVLSSGEGNLVIGD